MGAPSPTTWWVTAMLTVAMVWLVLGWLLLGCLVAVPMAKLLRSTGERAAVDSLVATLGEDLREDTDSRAADPLRRPPAR